MRLVIVQTLGLWLLAGTAFWAAFVVLGLRFVEARHLPAGSYGPAGAPDIVGR